MEWLSKILEIAKLSTRIIVWIFILSGTLIFSKKEWLAYLSINNIINNYKEYIGIAFWASGILILLDIFINILERIKRRRAKGKYLLKALNKLTSLDSEEKAVLREFILQGRNTILLPINHPVIFALYQDGIISIVGQYGEISLAGPLYSFKITEEIKHLVPWQLFGLHGGNPTQEEIEFIIKNRPEFIKEIEMKRLIKSL